MKVLVADKLAESGIERLRQHEHEVAVRPDLTGDELIDALGRLSRPCWSSARRRSLSLRSRHHRVSSSLCEQAPATIILMYRPPRRAASSSATARERMLPPLPSSPSACSWRWTVRFPTT